MGLTELGYGNYEVRTAPTIRAAVQMAAVQMRLTNRPVGLMTWRGAHSWVMSGFTSTVDPAVSDKFKVVGIYIEDVWWPRISSIWGPSDPPDTLEEVARPRRSTSCPGSVPRGTYPDKDGLYVMVVPIP